MYRILLVDDEPELLVAQCEFLIEKGCTIDIAETAQEAKSKAKQFLYDCILLDVLLGARREFELCAKLALSAKAPVIFLSNFEDEESQLKGFEYGGADYITKSTGNQLIWAKIDSQVKLRRQNKRVLEYGDLLINISERKVFFHKAAVSLTSMEMNILILLATSPKVTFTVPEIYRNIWGTDRWDLGQTAQVHLSHLRRKLDLACPNHSFIETIWGKGYRFVPIE